MKVRILTVALLMGLSSLSVGFAQSPSTVVDWMYSNELTIFETQESFGRDRGVTRGEISKFFTKFAEVMGLQKTKTTSECQFNDIEGYDYTLVPNIIEACEYGLVKGHNGNYYPNNLLTLAEALTVVIRATLGNQDETMNPRRQKTYEAAGWMGILDGEGVWDLDVAASRGKVGTRLYRVTQVDTDTIKKEGTDELKDILTEIFGDDFWEE